MASEELLKSGFVSTSMNGNNLCQLAMSCRTINKSLMEFHKNQYFEISICEARKVKKKSKVFDTTSSSGLNLMMIWCQKSSLCSLWGLVNRNYF